MEIDLKYTQFKIKVSEQTLIWQYIEETKFYIIYAVGGDGIKYNTTVWKDTSGITGLDEEAEAANKPFDTLRPVAVN